MPSDQGRPARKPRFAAEMTCRPWIRGQYVSTLDGANAECSRWRAFRKASTESAWAPTGKLRDTSCLMLATVVWPATYHRVMSATAMATNPERRIRIFPPPAICERGLTGIGLTVVSYCPEVICAI